MSHSPKVSIVMPSLNVRPYITVCIESVINQTLRDIEIICVDAGSTDGTLEILQDYARRDSRIKILMSDRKSYGRQVNLGFKEATGDYFAIVETDDVINLQMYETLYTIAEAQKVDLIKADFCRFSIQDGVMKKKYDTIAKPHMYNRVLYAEQDRKDIITGASLYTWSGIYKRDFLLENGIFHNETPGASYQDNGFWFQTMSAAKTVYFYNKPMYMLRRDNPNSSTQSKEKVYCIRDEYEFVLEYLKARPALYEKVISYYWWARFGAYRYNYRRIDTKFKAEFIHHFYDVFKPVVYSQEFDSSIFSKTSYNDLMTIMKDPDIFDRKHQKDTHRNLQKRTYLNRLKWCYEDNGLIYTVQHIGERVLIKGKKLLGIGRQQETVDTLNKRIDKLEKKMDAKIQAALLEVLAENRQLFEEYLKAENEKTDI